MAARNRHVKAQWHYRHVSRLRMTNVEGKHATREAVEAHRFGNVTSSDE